VRSSFLWGCLALCLSLFPATGISSDQDRYLSYWLELLRQGNAQEKQLALGSLGILRYEEYRKDTKVLDPIFAALKDKDSAVREAAAAFWTHMEGPLGISMFKSNMASHFLPALQDDVPAVRAEIAKAIAVQQSFANQQLVDALIKGLRDKDIWVRVNVVYALGELGKKYWSFSTKKIPLPDQQPIMPRDNHKRRTKSGAVPGGVTAPGADPPYRSTNKDGSRGRRRADTHEIAHHPALEDESALSDCVPSGNGYKVEITKQLLASAQSLDVSGAIVSMTRLLEEDVDWRDVFVKQEVVYAFAKMHVEDEEAIGTLLRKYDHPYLKKPIIETLGIIGALQAEQALLRSLEDNDESIRKIALNSLSALPIKWAERKKERTIQIYKDQLTNRYPEARIYAVRVLARAAFVECEKLIVSLLGDRNESVVIAVVEELGRRCDDRFLKDLIPLFASDNELVRDASVKAFHQIAERTTKEHALGERKGTSRSTIMLSDNMPRLHARQIHRTASGLLIAVLAKGSVVGTMSALSILDDFEDERIEPQLIRLLDNNSLKVRNRSAFLLREYGTDQAVAALVKALDTADRSLKLNLIFALDVIGDMRAKDPLIAMLKDKDETVRSYALSALGKYDDSSVADASLRSLSGETSGADRASAIKLLGNKRDPRAVELTLSALNEYWGPSEFMLSEFGDVSSQQRVSEILERYGLLKDQELIISLNKLLDKPDLYKKIKHDHEWQRISKRLEMLEQRYNRSQKAPELRILNRGVLEEFYPQAFHKRYDDKTGNVIKVMPELEYLGKIGEKRAVEPILSILENEMKKGPGVDDHYKVPLVSALGRLDDLRPVGVFAQLLRCKESSNPLKEEVLKALGRLKAREAVSLLRQMLQDGRNGLVMRAIQALGEIGDPQVIDDLKAKLYQDTSMSPYVVKALLQIGGDRATLVLIEYMVGDGAMSSHDDIFSFVQSLDRNQAVRFFLKFAGTAGRADRRIVKVVEILKTYKPLAQIEQIARRSEEEDRDLWVGYVLLLGELRDPAFIKPLKQYLRDPDPRVRKIAQESLEVIEASSVGNNAEKALPASQGKRNFDASIKNRLWSQRLAIRTAFANAVPMALDGQSIYLGGFGARTNPRYPVLDTAWKLEKRAVADGASIPKFGDQGIVSTDATGRITGLAIEAASIYMCGFDEELTTRRYLWRVEKRRSEDGLLDPEFGTGGIVKVKPQSNNENLMPSAILSVEDNLIVAGHWTRSSPMYTSQARLEKRSKKTGALVAKFGMQGVVMIDAYDILAVAADASNIYVAAVDHSLGVSDARWHIQKRSLENGSLVSSFGLDGIVTENPGPSEDQINALAVEGDYLYAVGFSVIPGKYTEWRIEKRRTSDGALVPSFGRAGIVTSSRGTGYDRAISLAIDRITPGFMYIVGRHSAGGTKDKQWRIEKRRLDNGSLVADFGEEGIITYNPSELSEGAAGIVADDRFIYVTGDDYSQVKSNSAGGGMWQLLKFAK